MVYKSDGSIEIRNGSATFKNSNQWGEVAVIGGKGYELDESGAEVMAILEDGNVYYIKVADYSDNPRRNFQPDEDWIKIDGFLGSADPVLDVTNKNKVFCQVVNNRVYFCDGTNLMKLYGEDHVLTAVPDPAGFEIKAVVGTGVAASLDSFYVDSADPTRVFTIQLEKFAGTGTELVFRQISGNTRPDTASGTLTLQAGTGDTSISYTDLTFSDNFICLANIAGRLVAVSDQGDVWISSTNDGADFTGPQAERLLYGKEDGLSVTDAFAFARSVILDLTNDELEKAATASLTGNVRPDPNIITQQNPEDFFRIQRESNRIALYGRSGKEVNQGFVGLSRDGYIFVSTTDARREFGINNRESISGSIQNVVNRVTFKFANNIRSTIDDANQRYLCAVPASENELSTLVFMYDFDNSTFASANKAAVHKWSFFTFNLNGAGITSMFTIFGVPFLGLSDGNIIQTEVEDTYLDSGRPYRSAFALKSFDFGVRHKMKKLKRGIIDFTLDEKTKLNIYPVTDEFARKRDYDGNKNDTKLLTPINLENEDIWTRQASDIWTSNPLDIWGRTSAERYTYDLSKTINKFQEMSVVVENVEGGKKWGSYGFEMVAVLDKDYFDGRMGENINVDDDKPID